MADMFKAALPNNNSENEMTTAHTATPWEVESVRDEHGVKEFAIVCPNGRVLFDSFNRDVMNSAIESESHEDGIDAWNAPAKADAEFIVRACNRDHVFDDLVEALKRIKIECDLEGLRNKAGFDSWLNLADAALAKAGAA